MEQVYGEVCAERDELQLALAETLMREIELLEELENLKAIAKAGGLYVGKQEIPHPDMRGNLLLFNVPVTHTTLAVWECDCEVEKIKVMIRASNLAFGIGEPQLSTDPPFGLPDSLESHSAESVSERPRPCERDFSMDEITERENLAASQSFREREAERVPGEQP